MRLAEDQEMKVYDYIMEHINPSVLYQSGFWRIGNFLVTYKRTVNDKFDPEDPLAGDPECWFEIWVGNNTNMNETIGTYEMTPMFNDDDDIIQCLHEALTDLFTTYEWESDKWSMDTFGF